MGPKICWHLAYPVYCLPLAQIVRYNYEETGSCERSRYPIICRILTETYCQLLIGRTILSTGIWQGKGCYINKAPLLALPDSFDNNVDKIQGNDNIFEYCSAKARSFGYNVFGADDRNCWAGDDAENTYNKYGESSTCSVGKSGNGSGKEINGDMFVYQYHEWSRQVLRNVGNINLNFPYKVQLVTKSITQSTLSVPATTLISDQLQSNTPLWNPFELPHKLGNVWKLSYGTSINVGNCQISFFYVSCLDIYII